MTHSNRAPDNLWNPAPQRIAVFRALQLGDMLCSVPALRALRAGAPHAQITLIGLRSARSFADRYWRYIDDFIEFPGTPDFPEQAANMRALPDFFAQAVERKFDLAIQLHGSGEHSNQIVQQLGAARVAGFHPTGLPVYGEHLFMPWPEHLPEVRRYIKLMRFLGLPEAGDYLEFCLDATDWREWDSLSLDYGLSPNRYVCVHAGARMKTRRWPVERFANVAANLAQHGWNIVLTGAAEEASLTAALALELEVHHRIRAIDLAGKTSLGGLAALISRSSLLVCNDTGVSHVAAALGARSIVIACGSDVARWAPLDQTKHRVLSHDVPCRPCMHQECPYGHPCALGVAPQAVLKQAAQLLGGEVAYA